MTDIVVVDASAAIRASIEAETGHAEAATCLEALATRGTDVVAPEIFRYEVGNVLARAAMKPAKRIETMHLLHASVRIAAPSPAAFERAMTVASDGKLSFYDAAYLALAEELRGTLWTEDKDILKRFPGPTASTAELTRRLR